MSILFYASNYQLLLVLVRIWLHFEVETRFNSFSLILFLQSNKEKIERKIKTIEEKYIFKYDIPNSERLQKSQEVSMKNHDICTGKYEEKRQRNPKAAISDKGGT